MVKIRLMRVGKKKQPSYRVVVADSRSPRDGRIIEAIGHYHPREEPSEIVIDSERAVHWLRHGAQPSDQVRALLKITGAWSEFTGEAPPAAAAAAGGPKKATPAASIKATPAASVSDEAASDEASSEDPGDEPAVLPEAVDQSGSAPEADTAEEDAAAVPEGEATEGSPS